MIAPGFGHFLLDALGVQAGEQVAVVADAERVGALTLVRSAAEERGARLHAVVTRGDYRTESEMPADAKDVIGIGDAVLLLVSTDRAQFGGHAGFRRAASARGARFAFVVEDRLPSDVELLAASCSRTRELADRLSAASRVEVRTAAGTDLVMDITSRPGIPITPELHEPGAWGALPDYMEAAVAPVEGTAHGTIVVDGTCTHTGIQTGPMVIEVVGGSVTALRGGSATRLQQFLDASGDAATRNLAELGIGTNELARDITRIGTFLDKRMAGTAHFGLGDNISLAGRTTAPLHTDVQVLAVSIDLDGSALFRAGEYVA